MLPRRPCLTQLSLEKRSAILQLTRAVTFLSAVIHRNRSSRPAKKVRANGSKDSISVPPVPIPRHLAVHTQVVHTLQHHSREVKALMDFAPPMLRVRLWYLRLPFLRCVDVLSQLFISRLEHFEPCSKLLRSN